MLAEVEEAQAENERLLATIAQGVRFNLAEVKTA